MPYFLFYGNKDSLPSVSRFHKLLHEAMHPDAGVHHHSHLSVFAEQDAALRVLGGIARIDAVEHVIDIKFLRQHTIDILLQGNNDFVSLGDCLLQDLLEASLDLLRSLGGVDVEVASILSDGR